MEISQNQDTSIQNEAIIPDSEIAKFKKIRGTYGIVLIAISILLFFVWLFLWYYLPEITQGSSHPSVLFFVFIFVIFISGTVMIFSFLFLRNENNLEIAKFLSLGITRRLSPGVRYGLISFSLFILTPTFLFKIENINDLIMHYSGMVPLLVSLYFFINGFYNQFIRTNTLHIYRVLNSNITMYIAILGFLIIYIGTFWYMHIGMLNYKERQDVLQNYYAPHHSSGCEFC